MTFDVQRSATWLLRVTAAVMLLGHAGVCWNGDMPLRALLWDEDLAAPVVKSLTGLEWGEWVGSVQIDENISTAIRVQAGLFLAMAITVLMPLRGRALAAGCIVATLNLTFLAWLKHHDAARGIGEFTEHLGQVLAPLVLMFWVRGSARPAWWVAAAGIACTFIGHGLFALDLESQTAWANHPRPGHFTEMTMLCLGFETETAANRLLVAAGVLDLLAAALLFTVRWPRIVARWWMVGWGFATALARPWAYFDPVFAVESLFRWIPEALYRVPHFGIPIFLLLALRARRRELVRQTS